MGRERRRRNLRPSLILAAFGLFLGACAFDPSLPEFPSIFGEDLPIPACPKIKLLRDASQFTQFRPGPGRDITDIVVEARLTGFRGDCGYTEDDGKFTSVDVSLRPLFQVTRGPANRARSADVTFFVAIPKYYPASAGRSEFRTRIAFPANRNSLDIISGEIEIKVPLVRGTKGPDIDIFLGFVVSREQLERNRQRRRRPSLQGG